MTPTRRLNNIPEPLLDSQTLPGSGLEKKETTRVRNGERPEVEANKKYTV